MPAFPSTMLPGVAGVLLAVALLSLGSTAGAEPNTPELVIRNTLGDGQDEVSSATLKTIIATADPTTPDERELVLQLRLELLGRSPLGGTNEDKVAAAELSRATMAQARALYGTSDAKLIPVLRMVAQLFLRLGDPKSAIVSLDEAYKIARQVHGAEDPATRFVLKELGDTHVARGDATRGGQLRDKAAYLARLAPATLEGVSVLAPSKPSDPRKPYQLIPVFFQTTRVKTGSDDPQAFFGADRTATASFGVSYVSVPRQRESGTIPHASLWRLDFSTDPNRHVILKGVSLLDGEEAFLKAVRDKVGNSERKETLLYIHGFNQSFQDAMESAATLAVDLEIDGSVVAFSWPSKDHPLKYVADMDEATATVNKEALKGLLASLSNSVGTTSVYVIAHSMGNRLLLDAMQLMPGPGAKPPLTSVVFASPDVESNEFETGVGKVRGQAGAMTLYTAGSDMALSLSERIRNGLFGAQQLRRAGDRDGGVRSQPYLDVVDTSKAQADWLGHSNFTQLAKDDLRGLLWLGLPARKRCVLVSQQPGWRYEPGMACPSEAFGMATLYFRRLGNSAQATERLNGSGTSAGALAAKLLARMLTQ